MVASWGAFAFKAITRPNGAGTNANYIIVRTKKSDTIIFPDEPVKRLVISATSENAANPGENFSKLF
jgi:hypothetical protein